MPGSIRPSPARPSTSTTACPPARRAGHRQGRDGQSDPLVQGPRDVDGGRRPGGGGEDRPRTARSSAPRPATSARASRTRPARSASLPSCSPRSTPTAARSRGCGRSARRSSRSGEDFDAARAASEAYAARASGRAARRRRRSADRDRGRRAWPLELTDAVAARPPAGARGHRRAGRQRGADQRHRVVAAHAAPGCRVVGIQAEGAAAMTLSFRQRPRRSTPTRPRPTPTASPRASRSRARSS